MYDKLQTIVNRLCRRIYWAKTVNKKEIRKCLNISRKEYRRIWRIYVKKQNGRYIVADYEQFIPRERVLNKIQEKALRILMPL